MDKANQFINRALGTVNFCASELESKALCQDRLYRIIRPIFPEPLPHIVEPSQLTVDKTHSFIYWQPPLKPRSDDKPVELYSPWGYVSTSERPRLIVVQEPWWAKGKHVRLNNHDGSYEQRIDGEWSTDDADGGNPADWVKQGWSRMPTYQMPHAWSRFSLRLDKVDILLWPQLTWPMIAQTGFFMHVLGGRVPTQNKQRQVFEQIWNDTYKAPSTGYPKYGVHQASPKLFIWSLTVWPSHLEEPRLLRPTEQPVPMPKVPGTFSATERMRQATAQVNGLAKDGFGGLSLGRSIAPPKEP